MTKAITIAIQRTDFCQADDLSFVSAPKAAAVWILGSRRNNLVDGETFVLLDAGGSTSDAATYTLVEDKPPRLIPIVKSKGMSIFLPRSSPDILAPGKICGSSSIIRDFTKQSLAQLAAKADVGEKEYQSLKMMMKRGTAHHELPLLRAMDGLAPDHSIRVIIEKMLRDMGGDPLVARMMSWTE